jgi:inosose dehydratase
MSEEEWPIFLANLQRLEGIVGEAGLQTALHPHWSMAIEDGRDVERLLDASDVGLCLDTGHLYLAGTDPVSVARMAPDRVLHVHLKDVDAASAEKVRSGEVPFRQAVIDGLFTPLGAGGVDIEGVIRTLEGDGFRGWYVLEQDVSLPAEPAPGAGPKADAVESVDFLRQLAATL